MEKLITKDLLAEGYSFNDFQDLMDELAERKATTGSSQSESLINITRLNQQRIHRIYKTTEINESLKELVRSIDEPLNWLILDEAWCGDGAQIIPYIALIAGENPLINFRILLRDEHTNIMDKFLTDGKRAIPKLIILDQEMEPLATWGPRPAEAVKIHENYMNNPQVSKDEFLKELHLWYARDKGMSIMKEVYDLLLSCCQKELK